MSNPQSDDDLGCTVNAVLYPEGGTEKAVRQLFFGVQPFVLLEASTDENGDVVLEFTGSLINDHEELLEFIKGYAEMLEDALAERDRLAAEEASRG